ncbi:Hypothetical predicted protein, partial [Marmota monax]
AFFWSLGAGLPLPAVRVGGLSSHCPPRSWTTAAQSPGSAGSDEAPPTVLRLQTSPDTTGGSARVRGGLRHGTALGRSEGLLRADRGAKSLGPDSTTEPIAGEASLPVTRTPAPRSRTSRRVEQEKAAKLRGRNLLAPERSATTARWARCTGGGRRIRVSARRPRLPRAAARAAAAAAAEHAARCGDRARAASGGPAAPPGGAEGAQSERLRPRLAGRPRLARRAQEACRGGGGGRGGGGARARPARPPGEPAAVAEEAARRTAAPE